MLLKHFFKKCAKCPVHFPTTHLGRCGLSILTFVQYLSLLTTNYNLNTTDCVVMDKRFGDEM